MFVWLWDPTWGVWICLEWAQRQLELMPGSRGFVCSPVSARWTGDKRSCQEELQRHRGKMLRVFPTWWEPPKARPFLRYYGNDTVVPRGRCRQFQ